MKTYKIKSLVYFSCFLMASILYYGIEKKLEFEERLQAGQIVELAPDEELEEDNEKPIEERP